MAAIAATLARYSESIITEVTHPVNGLPSRSSWLPTVKEVREACEVEADRIERNRRYANWGAGNKPVDAPRIAPPVPEKRLTIEELHAKYGKDWGLTETNRGPPQPAPSWDVVTEAYAADPGRLDRLLSAREKAL